jgi:hypothetical protein
MIDKLSLTQSDLENLKHSFITPELAEQAGLFRVDDLEGSEIVGKKRKAGTDYSGVAFPYFFPEQTAPREYRLRRDSPDKVRQSDGTIKDEGKYLTSPGSRNMLYFSPGCRMEWLADIALPLVITEGFKQPLALHRASRHGLTDSAEKPRFVVIGLSGVWNFRGTIGKTTNPDGGRQDVKGFISDFNVVELNGRKVIILYDPDAKTKESVHFAEKGLAKELTERGANVYIADCPEMENCNGIDDVLGKTEREQNTDAAVKLCLEILEAAKPFKAEKVSQANQILCLAEDIELFHTSDRTAFASIEVGGHKEIHPVNSKSFRDYLSYQFYQEDGKSPSSQALQDAINSLSGKAKFEGKTQDVHIRLASLEGKIYLDLCNDEWQIIEIDADGCRVIEATDAPIRFRRTKAMLALPTPTENGDIAKLKSFLNVDDKNLTLILAWLVNCFRANYPFPILLISGEQGTAKSTATKVLRELVDPSLAPFRSAPRDERDLIIAATNAWICAFDNLSSVPNSLSDGFCRISTGGSLATRTLYSDDEETIFTAKRPIILNSIGDVASRSDLLDRALLIKLEAISKDKRKPEREFWAEFEKEKTSIFSALISAVSFALKNIENTSLAELPRMADFALWATAAEQALGLNAGDFMKFYTQNREDAHAIVLEDSPIFEAIQRICETRAEFNGTVKEFLELIDTFADDKTKQFKHYPKNARALRAQLERINPNLRQLEINITFPKRTKAGSQVSLEYGCKQPSQPSPSSPSPQNKAQNDDGCENTTIIRKTTTITNSERGDGWNGQDDGCHSNRHPTVIQPNINNNNGLRAKDDGDDGDDGHLQPYSNGNGKAEFVDIEI